LTKIKVCGIKNERECKSVCECDIDYIGLIFAPSPRQIDAQMGQKLAKIAHNYTKRAGGVFTDMSDDEITEIAKFCKLDFAQIYKTVSPELKKRLNSLNCEVWQVLSVGEVMPKISGKFDALLFDYKGANLGGNGESFDWNLLKNVTHHFGIAGGISAQNVAEALQFEPEFIDINSKVEDENGIKNVELINKIVKIVKG